MKDPRPEVDAILSEHLDACDTREVIYTYPSMQMSLEYGAPPGFVWWMVQAFTAHNPAIFNKLRRAYIEVGRFFKDLERLAVAEGKDTRVPAKLVEELQRRIMRAFFPEAFEIITHARGPKAERAARDLLKHTEREAWRIPF